jgi:subtilisin family serine protease
MNGSEREQDYRLLIGTQPFDPREVGTPARRRGAAESSAERAAAREAIIVQFTAALTKPDAVRLEGAYGLELDRYIPNLAYLERLPAETIGRLRTDFLVRACIPLDPALKLAPWIADSVQPAPGAPLELIATLFDDADISAVEPALGAIGVRDIQIVDDRPIGGRVHARFVLDDPARLAQIADVDEVVWVEPIPVIVSANMEATQVNQSGLVGTFGNPIWDQKLHGEGQVISVTDTVVDINHCFFAGTAPNKPGKKHRKVLAMINPADHGPDRHGTLVAGIAVGDGPDKPTDVPDAEGRFGIHRHRGGAWAAKLVAINRFIMDQEGFKWTFFQVLTRAKEAGAFIHNASWGDVLAPFYSTLARDTDVFSWENEYHVVIAAGENTRQARFNCAPGIAKNTLCVAAAAAPPNHMFRGSGVSGPTHLDKRRKPDLMAVGCGIITAMFRTPCGTTAPVCGTSAATPQTSAAAALVRQYFMEGWYVNGEKQPGLGFTPTGALIRAVLLNSTVDMTGHGGYPSDDEGWGLIRLNLALYFKGGPRRLIVKDVKRAEPDAMRLGDERTHWLYVNSRTEQLKITLVWTDPPPIPYSFANPSVNVIRLTVEDPAGLKYLGNDFDFAFGVSTGVSRPSGAGPQDVLNNVQMVIVNNPPIGRWTITLRADRVTGDEQGYALVASGGLVFVGLKGIVP